MKTYKEFLLENGASAGKLELVKTSVETARKYLKNLYEKNSRIFEDELPEFDNNYSNVQILANYGRTKRKDMPVIDEKDVKLFQRRLKNGSLDINAPHSKEFINDPFPQGLAGKKAKDWLESGLPIHDGANKKDDVIKVSKTLILVGELKPIQQQIYFDRAVAYLPKYGVQDSINFLTKKSYFIVSNDNFIIDGHHRWLLANIIDKNMKVQVLKIDLPMVTLLPLTLAYSDAIGNKRNA
jgi:hypothetical protein